MSHELTGVPLSKEEKSAARSFMEDAAEMLHEYLGTSDLHIWRGKQKWLEDSPPMDTLIISQPEIDWGENRPREGYLLWVQKDGISVAFDVNIGTEQTTECMPFGGGCSPIKRMNNLTIKLTHLDLSIQGSQLMDLVKKQLMNLCHGASVHSEVCESGGQTLYRCDVYNDLTDEDWFCAAFLLNEAGQVGIWTRDDFERLIKFHEVDFNHDFTDHEQTGWIDDILTSDTVLNELTR